MGAYPPGCTQAMHDRAFGDETREKCQTCDGTADGGECLDCDGTGYEPIPDTRSDDAYDEARDLGDVEF